MQVILGLLEDGEVVEKLPPLTYDVAPSKLGEVAADVAKRIEEARAQLETRAAGPEQT